MAKEIVGIKTISAALVAVFCLVRLAHAVEIPPTPTAHYYGDADGNVSLNLSDIAQHNAYTSFRPCAYDTLQPQTGGQYWNTCDVDGNRSCNLSDIAILNSYMSFKPVNLGGDPWVLEDVNLPLSGNAANTWLPFNINLYMTYSGAPSGRPGISIIAEIDPTSPGHGQLSGRSCTPVAGTRDQLADPGAQCALAVTITDWQAGQEGLGLTESGTYGFQVWGDGDGDLKIDFHIEEWAGIDIPSVTLSQTVSFSPFCSIDLQCPSAFGETSPISCPFVYSGCSGSPQIGLTDTCVNSSIADNGDGTGTYNADAQGEAAGPGSCIAEVIMSPDGISDSDVVIIEEENQTPRWQTSPVDISVPTGYTYILVNGRGIDDDLPAQTLACSSMGDTCSFNVSVTGGGPGAVDCNISFIAGSSAEICSVNVRVSDEGGLSITKNVGIYVMEPCILFVDDTATGMGNGWTWNDAFNVLHDAVDNSWSGCQVWVAEGTYTNESGVATNEVLLMKEGVEIYGGFMGTETNLSERGDPADHPSILDGESSSFHVVVGASNATLDGFTVTGGNAILQEYYCDRGGGMLNTDITSLIIADCIFTANTSITGGGMTNQVSSLTIYDCSFIGNSAQYAGGMENGGSSPTLYDCSFFGNSAAFDGAGIINWGSSPVISGCTFSGNAASEQGGGIVNGMDSSPNISNCIFTGNSAITGGGIVNYSNASPTITGCVFSENTVTSNGGGISNNGNSFDHPMPTITNCNFDANFAMHGAGIYNLNSLPSIGNCVFSGNYTSFGPGGRGGAGIYNDTSSPDIYNCDFNGNLAFYAGGVYNTGSSPNITNCIFKGNIVVTGGGAIYNNNSFPEILNCTFNQNRASGSGGALYNSSSSLPLITNCIIWDDMAPTGPEIYNNSADADITYSDVQGGYTGTGNIDTYPLFVNTPDFSDVSYIVGTTNTIRVLNAALYEINDVIEIDGDGVPRLVSDASGTTVTFNPAMGLPTTIGMTIENWGIGATNLNADLRLRAASPCIDAGTDVGAPAGDIDGNPRPDGDGFDMGAYEYHSDFIVWYVDVFAAGTGSGRSWVDAFTTIQAGINAALSGEQVWVAQGVYINESSVATNEVLLMKEGVEIYGGFIGTESNLSERGNPADHPSFLDGYLSSHHVVIGASNARLDGFTIMNGIANGADGYNSYGGGMLIDSLSSLTITNCIFNANFAAIGGGGIVIMDSSITLTNCTVSGNISADSAGGIYNLGAFSFPTITNCYIINNSAAYAGGGMIEQQSSSTITNCYFGQNSADYSGGLDVYYASPNIVNCQFIDNSAFTAGAGMMIYNSSPDIFNCVFSGNTAETEGGGIRNLGSSSSILTNCTFNGNVVQSILGFGGAIYTGDSSLTATNSIFWGNTANYGPEIYNINSTPVVTYSDIQGGYMGTGNINLDPLFIGVTDYHLQEGSPCKDTGTATGAPSYDLEGNPRPSCSGYDMGAYEYQCP